MTIYNDGILDGFTQRTINSLIEARLGLPEGIAKDCMFCDNEDLFIEYVEHNGKPAFRVRCPRCNAVGPSIKGFCVSDGILQAIAAWNRRGIGGEMSDLSCGDRVVRSLGGMEQRRETMNHDELIRKIYEFYQTDRDREACPVCGGCNDYHKRDCFYPDLQDALLEIAMGEGGNQT